MTTAFLPTPPPTSVLDIDSYSGGLNLVARTLDEIVNDLWMQHSDRVTHVYVLDFQEIYNYIRPLGSSRMPGDQLGLQDVLAERVLGNENYIFALLPGTELELGLYLNRVSDDVIPITNIKLQKEVGVALRDIADRLKNPDILLNKDSGTLDALSAVSHALSTYDLALSRLEQLLRRVKAFDYRQLLGNRRLNINKGRVEDILSALEQRRPRETGSPGSQSNYADAINLAAIEALNSLFDAAFKAGELDQWYVFHLFTHTPTLFGLGPHVHLDVFSDLSGRTTTLLKKPFTLFLEQRLRDNFRGAEEEWLIREIEQLKNSLGKARTALHSVRAKLVRRNETLEDLLIRCITAPGMGYDNLASEMSTVVEFMSAGFLRDTQRQLEAMESITTSVPSPSSPDQDVEAVWFAATRVADRCEQLEDVLKSQYSIAKPSLRKHLNGKELQRSRDGFFDATRMGFLRTIDGEVIPDRRCRVFRLIHRSGKEFALEIDLFDGYYLVYWHMTSGLAKFYEGLSDVLEKTGYIPKYSYQSVFSDMVELQDAGCNLYSFPVHLPLKLRFHISDDATNPLVDVCVHTARGIYFATVNSYHPGQHLCGVISTRKASPEIRHLYGLTSGEIPDSALEQELSIFTSVKFLAPFALSRMLKLMRKELSAIPMLKEQQGLTGYNMWNRAGENNTDSRARGWSQKLLCAAVGLLEMGDVARARKYYDRAIRIDPGVGLIGEVPSHVVVRGKATFADTRQEMVNPEAPSETEQGYYWTSIWQRDELEADRDLAAGRVRRFDSVLNAIEYLTKLS